MNRKFKKTKKKIIFPKQKTQKSPNNQESAIINNPLFIDSTPLNFNQSLKRSYLNLQQEELEYVTDSLTWIYFQVKSNSVTPNVEVGCLNSPNKTIRKRGHDDKKVIHNLKKLLLCPIDQ
ncbi:hypothetical protein M0812_11470 [Anaeramoeba flamelloides]|uniref:Uncharacterized protein n=1 Tax=Anaeramoeba flamelloides TaxID=1746091 RepID=A0AAV7ZXR2_9EUKA|nr:hypothetical protein M0812_11470 [Anaeramoeba flamelloides]